MVLTVGNVPFKCIRHYNFQLHSILFEFKTSLMMLISFRYRNNVSFSKKKHCLANKILISKIEPYKTLIIKFFDIKRRIT